MWLHLASILTFTLLAQVCIHAQDEVIAATKLNIAPAPNDAQQQTTPEFLKPLVNLELSFVMRVCEPSKEQMNAIVEGAKKAFEAMADLVGNEQSAPWGNIVFLGPNQERLTANPFDRTRNDIAKFLKPLVSEEQYKKYIDESNKRAELEREVAVLITIDLIDRNVALDELQQVQLMEKLKKGWDKADFQHLQNYHQNSNYLPTLPDHLIEPFLNRAQREIWRTAKQSRATMYVSMTDGSAFGVDEEWIK